MNRIGTVVIRIIVISLALGLLVFAQKQPSKPSIQSPSPSSGNTSPTEQTSNKKGRNLVAKLPAGVEGVILGNGQVKLKPGYKFVKQENGKVSVDDMKGTGGGLSVGGTWDCVCRKEQKGTCKASIVVKSLECSSKSGCSDCVLVVDVGDSTKSIVSYSTKTTIAN